MNGPEQENPQLNPPAAAVAPPPQHAPGHHPGGAAAIGGQDPRSKSPGLAGFLSLMPGLGQIYVGYYARGFVHAGVVVALITILSNLRTESLIPLFALPLVFFWLYNVIDATRRASLYNRYLAGEGEIQLPEDFNIPAFGGSIVGGVVLIVFGAALLLHTRFDVSLEWIADWWPLGPILFGVYLVWKAVQERAGQQAG